MPHTISRVFAGGVRYDFRSILFIINERINIIMTHLIQMPRGGFILIIGLLSIPFFTGNSLQTNVLEIIN